ncbi:DnaD domain protein [Selenomonas noxia]|uniref:DnaD domain-containing protein n=1 Tax=Selenomonas noxia TaxID=135083 RepID=UPI0028E66ED9|nr:DnaD domain protein [Selenomonas noxia]
MAERRMFSKRIIGSARFLRMPGSTQALYFHLGMAADDDGIVEAYPIMQMVNASEDDLRLLAAKGFVKVLNEDLVTYILDWQENNKIRADRKVNSIYKDLLLQVMPETLLLEPRQRADRARPDIVQDNHGTTTGHKRDVPRTTTGQPMDNHGTQTGPHRIGKDRIGKDSIYAAAANARTRDDPQDQDGPDHGAVFRAFSDNIHPVTGEIERDKLTDLTDEYGAHWVTSAIEEAALSNGRSLRYITTILERWRRDGFKAPRQKGGKGYGTGSTQGNVAGDGAEKSPYAAYFDGDTVKGSPYDLGGTTEEGGDSAGDRSTQRGDPDGTGASSGSGSGDDQASA